MGPCAKQRVVAVVSIRGREDVIIGENICLNPQPVCPRLPGEAYAKCYTHCAQLGHAEETALRQIRMLGIDPKDILGIDVFGHSGPCDNCRSLLDTYGLLDITTFIPGYSYRSVTPQEPIAQAYNLHNPSSHSHYAKD